MAGNEARSGAAGFLEAAGAVRALDTLESIKDSGRRVGETLRSSIEFLRDVRKELNNVSWPSRRELTGTTMVVIVAVFFFGFFLWVVDLIVGAGMHYIFRASP